MTEENKQRIIRQFRDGIPVSVIADSFGVTEQFVSRLAHANGCPPRHIHGGFQLLVRLHGSVFDRLTATARRQRTSPEVLAREAIAAYLGADT